MLTSKKSIGTFNVPVCIGIVAIHVLALLALLPQFWSWTNALTGFAICVFFYIVTGLGVTLCYHRLLTHSSFKTNRWFRYFLTICGNLAFQGPPFRWVGVHRRHHNHSDEEEDPHSPLHGAWWAHYLWFMFNDPPGVNPMDMVKDLQKDPGLVLINRLYWVPQVALTIILFGLGHWIGGLSMALTWIFWGTGIRTLAVYHITWATNSICHMWGSKNFDDTGDESRNNLWLSILSFGESWHNNHHHDPSSAAHGTRHWWEIDPTYEVIRLLNFLGLVSDVRETKEKRELRKAT